MDEEIWLVNDERDLGRYVDQEHPTFVSRGVRSDLVRAILDSNPPPWRTDWTEWLHNWAPGAASRLNASLKLARLRDLLFRFANGEVIAGQMLPLAAEDYASGVICGPNLKVAWAHGFRTARGRLDPRDPFTPDNPYRASPARLVQLFTLFEQGDMDAWHWLTSKVIHDLTRPMAELSAVVAWDRGHTAGREATDDAAASKNPYR
jgi:hypothetical protein